MSRIAKSLFLMAVDAMIVASTPYISLFIRFEGSVEPHYLLKMSQFLLFIVATRLAAFYFFGLYNRLWRYASISELVAITEAISVSTVIIATVMMLMGAGIPRSTYILTWLFDIALIGCSRIGVRVFYHIRQRQASRSINVLIVGAGDAGAMIAREIQQRVWGEKKVIGFIDDDVRKHHQILYGAKVLGTRVEIVDIVANYQVQEIIVAVPSVGGQLLRQIVKECKKTNCAVKVVPGLYELIDGKVSIDNIRNVDLEDLLRREPVRLDIDGIAHYLAGKRVLVTGAGGSVGSELCRQVARLGPRSLLLLGRGENSIYEIHRELKEGYPQLALEPIIADIRNADRINNVFEKYHPEVVFHAAAHKHVPLMEMHPEEAVNNNIFGTKVVAEAAHRFGASVFVMISTDKAVNPTSIMGATKRVAELIIQNQGRTSKTRFFAVRFGNVLGSRGSVIPLFKKQIANGGPVTITHPDMKRYFMTIPEAAGLVLQAGALAQGGVVFVLDMGEPVKIVDMACDLIELSGLVPNKDIKIEYTGLRPGEKLFEELLTAEEGVSATRYEKIYVANLRQVEEASLNKILLALAKAQGRSQIIKLLMKAVPTYLKDSHPAMSSNVQLSDLGEQPNEQGRENYPPASGLH